ncbi:activator of HSP90 ATPase [Knoellia flava TL1]|uniref:Activator of HSP90 ATPase n=2 Tax=Knoellia flava TaxID=913969 RepID=A0A8H9KQW6_9MICO|nr:SRPBCC domain-containing protein [Knoellia flava]KGN35720.1 activator of HSP90 ATPase [Knoellia flava TL1]GGB81579.1 activator of HSP90 ATPase [Knoellia flava]
MPVTDITTDSDERSIVVTCDFAAPVDRIWDFWTDPRQLERWFGPPGYPLTVTSHDLREGGRMTYYMTSPEGEKFGGYWDVTAVEPTSRLAYVDGFADAEGNPAEGMPAGDTVVEFTEHDGGTRVSSTTVYGSADDLQKVLDMGMEEGLTQAVGQLDEALRADAA